MALIPTIEAIKKHGVIGVLVLVIFLMYSFFTKRFEVLEAKLERVELKLYDCMEDRIQTSKRQTHRSKTRLLINR
jgi:hypothetical protein